jgi:hypothetical protein
MKKLIFILIITSITVINAAEVTFNFARQSGSASNQFAVWIENSQGQFVKTLYATRWTANGGWSRRPTSIPVWVKQSGLSEVPHEMIDTVSGATPRTGALTYVWDGTDIRGASVPAGDYVLIIEGNLRWENMVYCRAPFRLGQGVSSARVNVEYTGEAAAERSMIGDISVRVLR